MTSVTLERTIDVTAIPPRQKHPAILQAWTDLQPGTALLLVNDHDPLPLYYQFACEFRGQFHWEYLERGPVTWRVRIAKGDYPDPGFAPGETKPTVASAPVATPSPRVVDTRPLFARGESPCQAIDDAVSALTPGQPLVLLVPFEPVPLYAKLGREGFLHRSHQLTDGTWRVEFTR